MPSKTQSILLGGAIVVALSLVNLFLAMSGGTSGQYLSSLVCCLTAILGAGAAVWHYTSTHRLTIPAGTGAGIGAAATAGGYLVAYVIGEGLQAAGVLPTDAEIMARTRDQVLRQNPEIDPAQLDQMMGMAESMSGVVGGLINLVILAVLGAIIGAVAASIFKKGTSDSVAV